jgi:hypothetical protein
MKVIVIHGSKTYFGKPSYKNLTYLLARKIIGEDPTHKYADDMRDSFIKKGLKSEVFYWNGDIFLWKIKKAAEKLAEDINKKRVPVIIFAKSNGAILAQFASMKTNLIKKIVQIGAPNLSKHSKIKIPLINIYSPIDNIQRRGIILNSIFNFSMGSRKLEGTNVQNIILNGKNHRDWNNKKMFGFYYKLLKD